MELFDIYKEVYEQNKIIIEKLNTLLPVMECLEKKISEREFSEFLKSIDEAVTKGTQNRTILIDKASLVGE